MQILTNYSDLIGKKIVFSHMAQFAEQITLATEDGSVLMATFDIVDDGEQHIRVLSTRHAMRVLKSDNKEWMRKELSDLGVFNLEEYQKEQDEIKEREREKRSRENEEKERKEYERLKGKFGKG